MTEISPSQRSLFRPESLRARELAWQGRAVLALGLPAAFTTFSSVALAAAIAALIIFGGYSRRVDMEGAVLPSTGVIAISAPSPGRIEMLAVQEGDPVIEGVGGKSGWQNIPGRLGRGGLRPALADNNNRMQEQRRAAAEARQPALFELRDDVRPARERTAAGRYREPSLFSFGDS